MSSIHWLTLWEACLKNVAYFYVQSTWRPYLMTPVTKPVILIGLPRTGTTLLHNLLSLDERFLAPMTWELARPVPPGRPDDWRNCQRFTDTRDELEYFVSTSDIMTFHPIYVDRPEECYFILQYAFYSVHHFLYLKTLTERADWFYNLPTQDAVQVYEFFKASLQCLGYKGMDNRNFLLKCYVHQRDPEALLKVFPDACLVYTHRAMSEVVPSYCAMTRSEFRHRWGECDNEYGKRVLRLMSTLSNNAVDLLQKYENRPESERPIIDIGFSDLTSDPIKQIERIYSQFGLTLTTELKSKMVNYMNNNPRYKYGKYSYSLEDFNLTKDDIKQSCGKYINYFESKGYKAL